MDLSQLVEQLRSQLSGIDGADLSTLDQLSQALEPYQGLDPKAARQAMTDLQAQQQQDSNFAAMQSERDELRSQLQTQQETMTQLQRELGAVRSMTSAGVRPEYEDLLLPKVSGALELGDTGATLPEGYLDGLKQQYPAAFFAEDAGGTGGAGQGGQAPASPTETLNVGAGGTITGVDPAAVLDGSVTIA